MLKKKCAVEHVWLMCRLLCSEFRELAHAMRIGDIRGFNDAMQEHERKFIRFGLYLVLEKAKGITYRNFFKRAYVVDCSTGHHTDKSHALGISSMQLLDPRHSPVAAFEVRSCTHEHGRGCGSRRNRMHPCKPHLPGAHQGLLEPRKTRACCEQERPVPHISSHCAVVACHRMGDNNKNESAGFYFLSSVLLAFMLPRNRRSARQWCSHPYSLLVAQTDCNILSLRVVLSFVSGDLNARRCLRSLYQSCTLCHKTSAAWRSAT